MIVSLFTACNKEERSSVVSWQNDYYPVKINSWISYQIEDIAIDKESAVNDTVKYQIKDVIASCIEENEHYKSYRIETYKRMHDKSNWEHWKNWELKVYPRAIHTIKDNVEKVVLLNPVRLKDKWDGNAYNTEEEKQYELDALKDSIWNGDLKKIARVKHADVYDLIEKITSFGICKRHWSYQQNRY